MSRTTILTAYVAFLGFSPEHLLAQGETTSAIVGEVVDPSGAAESGGAVTIISTETAAKRTATTDDVGRFSFPQLKPGTYTVRVEATGFEPQTASGVSSGLGQKQTVNFSLRLLAAKGEVTVSSEAPLINPENPNTSTTLNAPALESLPNPGADMTYPLQFAPGALMPRA